MMKIKWKDQGRAVGSVAMVGNIRVGSVRPYQLKTNPNFRLFLATCLLPGSPIPGNYERHNSEADARKVVELAIQKWFAATDVARIKTPARSDD